MNEIQSKVLGQYAKYIYVVTLYFYRKLHHCSISLYFHLDSQDGVYRTCPSCIWYHSSITIDRSRYTKNTVSVDYKMYMHEKKINTVGVTSRTGYCLPFQSTYVHPRVRVTRSLVLCVCFVDRCLSFCPFSFGHCVVCSSIYGFWLLLWYLQILLICLKVADKYKKRSNIPKG